MRLNDYSRWILNEVKETKSFTLLNLIGVWISVWVVVVFLSLALGVEQATIAQITEEVDLFTLQITRQNEDIPLPYARFASLEGDRRIRQIVPVFVDYLRIGPYEGGLVNPDQLAEDTIITYAENYFTRDASGDDQRTESLDLIVGRRLINADDNGIIVSEATFEKLGAVVEGLDRESYRRYPLALVVKRFNPSGAEEYIVFETRIVGIAETTPYNSVLTYLSSSLAEQVSDWKNFDHYQEVNYRGRSYDRFDLVTYSLEDLESMREQMSALNYATTSILDRIDNVRRVLTVVKVVFFLIFSIAILVAAFNIVITLTSAVLKRKHEIGILKSLGATDRQVQAIFVLHAVYLSVLGSIAGAVTAYLVIAVARTILGNFEALSGMNLFRTNFFDVILIIMAAIALSVLASFAPARRAAAITPIETLREV